MKIESPGAAGPDFRYTNIFINFYKEISKNHKKSSRDSPDENKISKKNQKKTFFNLFSILLINLSQTAYFDGLTLSDDRNWYGDSTGLNIIFIRAIGCSFMPGEGPI